MLEHDAEALWLGVPNTPALQPPSQRYLDFRYPSQPQYPVADAFGGDTTYIYHVNDEELLGLARRFPAVLALTRETDYRIYVVPSGHIVIRYAEPDPAMTIMQKGKMRWRSTPLNNAAASYRLPPSSSPAAAASGDMIAARPTWRLLETTANLLDRAQQNGGFPNPGRRPQGQGR